MQFSPRPDHLKRGTIQGASAMPRSGAIDIVVLASTAEATDVFRLRARAATARNGIEASPDQFADASDRERTTHQICLRRDEACIGAVRISLGFGARGPQGLPSSRHCPEVANIARNRRKRIVEISRLAVDPGIASLPLRTSLFATLVRAAYSATLAVEATDVLISAPAHSTRLYERLAGCVRIGTPASHTPGELEMALLWVTMAHLKRRQATCNSFFRIAEPEVKDMRRALFGAAADLGWLPGGLHMNPPAARRPPRGTGAPRR